MKIMENGKVREMTAEEIAAFQAQLSTLPEELTLEKKLELMLASIPEEPTPTVEPKLGYKWEPVYTPSAGFAWELVEDPNALGTQRNPRYWAEGMAVKMGHWYTLDGVTLYVALQDGVAPELADGDWFAKM